MDDKYLDGGMGYFTCSFVEYQDTTVLICNFEFDGVMDVDGLYQHLIGLVVVMPVVYLRC